jgi:hypothetical protein
LYNRQLHPDERKWAKDNASKFAEYYKEQTGQTLTADQAQQMLLANGYRLVDAAASKGPGGDAVAVAYISQNAGGKLLRRRRSTTTRSCTVIRMVRLRRSKGRCRVRCRIRQQDWPLPRELLRQLGRSLQQQHLLHG